MSVGGPPRPSRIAVSVVVGLGLLSSSCAYYNTFYLAKRYYSTATSGSPYSVEKLTGTQAGNYQKAIDYAKKVIANHPRSKWVDDAYLLWAQALLGKEDPLQTINMLLDFPARYPGSPRKDDATFFLGLAYRQARKHREALVSLDEYLARAPDRELAPYAHLERSRALMSLERPGEAAQSASQLIERFPQSPLVIRARAARAEALLAGGDPAGARQDFQALGLRAADDNERFGFLLREADCLEAARDYAGGLALLGAALSNEPAPVKSTTGAAPTAPGADRYGQLTLRIGTLHLLAGRPDEALAAYRRVLQDYPKHPLGAEAQYRIGYAHETALDDFDGARQEYAKVRDHSTSSAFFAQATQRQQSLDRLAGFRGAGTDSSDRQLEAGFLLAEQYLFQLDKPERALEAYAAIAREHPGTPAAGKAMNAEAWVLRRRLERPAEADSLLWRVVREYPATEAQLAARDYLESVGHVVPAGLIRMPEPKVVSADTTSRPVTSPDGISPPGRAPSPGTPARVVARDSSLAGTGPREFDPPGPATGGPSSPAPILVPDPALPFGTVLPKPPRAGAPTGETSDADDDSTLRAAAEAARRARADIFPRSPGDSLRRAPADIFPRSPGDSLRRAPADIVPRAPADTTRRAPANTVPRSPADTTRRAPADTVSRAPADTVRRAPARWIPTDTLRFVPR